MKKPFVLFALTSYLVSGCSPLTSSPYDGKYQLELTLHEVQTSLDDLRHDVNSFRSELLIVDGRMKHHEDALVALKNYELEKAKTKIEQLASDIQALEKKWTTAEKNRVADSSELKQLATHAKETSMALTQFKDRIGELEQDLIAGQRRFEEISKLKGNIDSLAKSLRGVDLKTYKVRSGDSLEKIAKLNKVSVDKLKKQNGIEQDLIVVGQELKIPSE